MWSRRRKILTALGRRNLQMNKVVPPQLGAVWLLGQSGSDWENKHHERGEPTLKQSLGAAISSSLAWNESRTDSMSSRWTEVLIVQESSRFPGGRSTFTVLSLQKGDGGRKHLETWRKNRLGKPAGSSTSGGGSLVWLSQSYSALPWEAWQNVPYYSTSWVILTSLFMYFQQTWKILILKTSSWLFSYHSGLHWKAHFRGCSTFWSIVQFQSCWTIEQKSWGKSGSYRCHRKLQATQRRHFSSDTHLWALEEMCSWMVACILLSNYPAGRDCTYMQGQQKILL